MRSHTCSRVADPTGGVGARERNKGAVDALLGGLGGAASKTESGLMVVDKGTWNRTYNQRTKSLRCGGANSRVHQCFDGAWRSAPADAAPPKEQDWSETLRSDSCMHGELRRLYGAGPGTQDEDARPGATNAEAATEAVDLYNEVSQLYGKQRQQDSVDKAGQPSLQRREVVPTKGSKDLQLLGSDGSIPMCLCGPGRRRLDALAQEQIALRRCVSAQRVALQRAHDAMEIKQMRGTSRSGRPRAQSARRRA